MRRAAAVLGVLATMATTLAVVTATPAAAAPGQPRLDVRVIADGLSIPWDLGFTPDGVLLYTERPGRIGVRFPTGERRTLQADLSDLVVAGESGLMGMVVDPRFREEPTHLHLSGPHRTRGAGDRLACESGLHPRPAGDRPRRRRHPPGHRSSRRLSAAVLPWCADDRHRRRRSGHQPPGPHLAGRQSAAGAPPPRAPGCPATPSPEPPTPTPGVSGPSDTAMCRVSTSGLLAEKCGRSSTGLGATTRSTGSYRAATTDGTRCPGTTSRSP